MVAILLRVYMTVIDSIIKAVALNRAIMIQLVQTFRLGLMNWRTI